MDTIEKRIEIACQQVLKEDGSVFSVQWAILPVQCSELLTPGFVMEKYFSYLRHVTLFLVRPKRTANGVEFRFISSPLHLLAFATPHFSDDNGRSVTLRICGGPFVQGDRCNRGRFSFCTEAVPGGIKVTVLLTDYHPKLLGSTAPSSFRKHIYRFTQAFVHKLVTTRFLAALYREMTGDKPILSIVAAHVEAGEDI